MKIASTLASQCMHYKHSITFIFGLHSKYVMFNIIEVPKHNSMTMNFSPNPCPTYGTILQLVGIMYWLINKTRFLHMCNVTTV